MVIQKIIWFKVQRENKHIRRGKNHLQMELVENEQKKRIIVVKNQIVYYK